MNLPKEVEYRLALAEGFLNEAEEDFRLERWRSCVDNAQMAVENAGKMVLALFGVVPKTHDPARQIKLILEEQPIEGPISELIQTMLPDIAAMGLETHFLTDYGDEMNYLLPWDIFTRDIAEEALISARHVVKQARMLRNKMLGA